MRTGGFNGDLPQVQPVLLHGGVLEKKCLSRGSEGLKPGYRRFDPQARALEEENARLKRIIARQTLEIEVKEELIKNGQARWRKGRRS